jgi:hypothetical protein
LNSENSPAATKPTFGRRSRQRMTSWTLTGLMTPTLSNMARR